MQHLERAVGRKYVMNDDEERIVSEEEAPIFHLIKHPREFHLR